jgi:hypothetical protein
MSKSERRRLREYVLRRYKSRGGRAVRIGSDGAVMVLLKGDGSQMLQGVDESAGRYFAGWAPELLREASF